MTNAGRGRPRVEQENINGLALKMYRVSLGLTKKSVAEAIDRSPRFLTRAERGEYAVVTSSILSTLASVLKVRPEDLCND